MGEEREVWAMVVDVSVMGEERERGNGGGCNGGYNGGGPARSKRDARAARSLESGPLVMEEGSVRSTFIK